VYGDDFGPYPPGQLEGMLEGCRRGGNPGKVERLPRLGCNEALGINTSAG